MSSPHRGDVKEYCRRAKCDVWHLQTPLSDFCAKKFGHLTWHGRQMLSVHSGFICLTDACGLLRFDRSPIRGACGTAQKRSFAQRTGGHHWVRCSVLRFLVAKVGFMATGF